VGQPISGPGISGGITLHGGYIPALSFLSNSGALTLQTEDGWNLLSVPLAVNDFRKTTLYPAALSVAFAYAGSYRARDTLQNGIGFWIKFSGSHPSSFSGPSIS